MQHYQPTNTTCIVDDDVDSIPQTITIAVVLVWYASYVTWNVIKKFIVSGSLEIIGAETCITSHSGIGLSGIIIPHTLIYLRSNRVENRSLSA